MSDAPATELSPLLRWAALLAPPLLAGLLLVASWPSEAADAAPPAAATRRLQIHIDYLRQADSRQGGDSSRGRLSQQLVLSALLQTDGTPMFDNPLDPEDGRRQMERAQAQQQRMQQRAQAAMARQGRGSVPAAAPADLQTLQTRALQLQARCGNDRDCLMREAMALSAVQVAGGDASVQGRLQAYGAAVQACERRAPAGAAREACIADARRQAGGGSDDSERDEVVETPYLHFRGQGRCQLDVEAHVDERIEGQFQDVQGTVPFSQTVKADQRRRDDTACPFVQAVLDTRNGRLWTLFTMAVPDLPGLTVRQERGRPAQRHDGPIGLRWLEAGDWLHQRLLKLNAGGEDQLRQPVGSDGQVELRLRWRFAPA